MQDRFNEALERCCAAWGLPAPPACLAEHQRLLRAWAPRLNLSAVSDPAEVAEVLFGESLLLASQVDAVAVVDVGSGAGFPGLPLAAAAPAVSVTLVESRRKRATFLQVVVAGMGLRNVRVEEGRFAPETPVGEGGSPALVSRATFPVPTWVQWLPALHAGSVHLLCSAQDAADARAPAGWKAEPFFYALPSDGRKRALLHLTRV